MQMHCRDSSQISHTPSTTSDGDGLGEFSTEEKAKTVMFFARIQTAYGAGRFRTIARSEEELRLIRREWAKEIGLYSIDQLNRAIDRLKQRLIAGDQEYRYPDVAKILALASEPETHPSHRLFPKTLPEPEWKRAERRKAGRIVAETCLAVLNGKACFIDDKPET